MFGFVIGGLSLLGLMKLRRFERGGLHHPRRWMVRRLFQHLDTTPGQEKVVLGALDEVERAGLKVRDAFRSSRGQFATALRGEHFDGAAVDAAFDAQQAAVEDVKKAVRAGLTSIHEALTPEQRKQVADLIEMGPRGFHGGCAHGC